MSPSSVFLPQLSAHVPAFKCVGIYAAMRWFASACARALEFRYARRVRSRGVIGTEGWRARKMSAAEDARHAARDAPRSDMRVYGKVVRAQRPAYRDVDKTA